VSRNSFTRVRPRPRVLLGALVSATLCASILAVPSCAQTPSEPAPSVTAAPASKEIGDYNDCMIESGWEPSAVYEDGSYGFSFTDAQAGPFHAANDACIEAIGANEGPDWTTDHWESFFAELLKQSDCLANEGIPVTTPPSFATWLDTGRRWGPYEGVPTELVIDRLEELESACPSPTS